MVVVKMVGGVSAVKSAVEAASVAAEKITQIISKHVIARPSDELDKIINAEKEKSDKKVEEVIVDEVQKEIVDDNQNDEVNEILEEIKEIQVVKGNKKHKNKK